MVMVQATLATELLNLGPETVEAVAIENFAEAYRIYSLTANAGPAAILPAGPTAGKAAMIAALVGMSGDGAAKGKLESAINQFWLAAIPPGWPTNVGFVAQPGTMAGLQATFDDNTSNEKTQADSTAAMAGDIHAASSNAGGTVTLPGAPPTAHPIT